MDQKGKTTFNNGDDDDPKNNKKYSSKFQLDSLQLNINTS